MVENVTKEFRSIYLSLGFGIASVCTSMGNPLFGAIFGIIALVFQHKAKKAGYENSDLKAGFITGLIGLIISCIAIVVTVLAIIFYFGAVLLTIFGALMEAL